MNFNYDLFVIGAGPGGLAASEQAATYKAKVAIAEQDLVGGTCVIRGCIPEKLMSFAAEFSENYQQAVSYGWSQDEIAFDWQQFIAAKEQEIHRLGQVHTQSLENAGIDLISGRATFIDSHTLEVGGRIITADKILIAVGGNVVKPNIPGSEYGIIPHQLFNLQQQPKHLAIIGGDNIAVKLAGIMNGLGSQVTLIIQEDQILSGYDDDIRMAVAEGLIRRGIQICDRTVVKEIKPVEDEFNLFLAGNYQNTLKVNKVLYAATRIPNVSGLALENVGVKVNQGAVVVDEYNRTTQGNIFAVGDCTNRWSYTPVAIAQARAFADSEFGNNPHTISYEYIPSTVSSHPEAATVGWSEAKAREQLGDAVRCYYKNFRPLLYSLPKRDEKILMKLIVGESENQVLGAHMVGEGAIEIIQCLALALRMGATKQDFDQTIGIHPSVAEEFFTMREV